MNSYQRILAGPRLSAIAPPDASAQLREGPVLSVDPMCRVAMAGGPFYEVLAQFPDSVAAFEAYKAAKAISENWRRR